MRRFYASAKDHNTVETPIIELVRVIRKVRESREAKPNAGIKYGPPMCSTQ